MNIEPLLGAQHFQEVRDILVNKRYAGERNREISSHCGKGWNCRALLERQGGRDIQLSLRDQGKLPVCRQCCPVLDLQGK